MKVAIIAPGRYNRTAMVQESNRAAADGHRVLAVVGDRDPLCDPDFTEDVEIRYNETGSVRTPAHAGARFWLSKAPMGLLKRLQRGPARRPVRKVRRAYKRHVVDRLNRRLKPAEQRLRRALYARYVADQVSAWDPDLVVLMNTEAIAVADEFLGWLEDRRPGAVVSYSYAEPVLDSGALEAVAHGS